MATLTRARSRPSARSIVSEKLALQVEEGGDDGSHRLAIERQEAARRPDLPPDRRLGHPHDEAVEEAVAERSASCEAARPAVLDGPFDSPDFPMSDNGQMRQALLDRPLVRRRTPVESLFVQAGGQFPGFHLDLFELPAVWIEFRSTHTRDYSEALTDGRRPLPAVAALRTPSALRGPLYLVLTTDDRARTPVSLYPRGDRCRRSRSARWDSPSSTTIRRSTPST